MKLYKYREEERTINDKKYMVIIPEKHSTIQALLYNVIDLNFDDDWANIPDWHTLCMILKKGEYGWEMIYHGSSRSFNIDGVVLGGVIGIFTVLFQLEKKWIRERILKNAEIREIKQRMNNDYERLKKLRGKNVA